MTGAVDDAPVAARLQSLREELARGTGGRFRGALEAEFRQYWAARTLDLVRSAFASAFLVIGLFVTADRAWLGGHLGARAEMAHVFGALPLLAVAFGLTFVPAMRRHVGVLSGAVMLAVGAFLVWGYPVRATGWAPQPYGFETLLVFVTFVYFFAGLLFRAATAIGLGIAIAFVASQWLAMPDVPSVAYCAFYLLGANLVGMTGRYALDRLHRTAFLNSTLAGALADHDSLTGLLNRRAFSNRLDGALRQARREGLPLALALVDLDGFKEVNDRAGHAAGDAVLVATAQALRDVARRPSDAAGRYGGDEFLCLWTGVDSARAAQFAESLRAAIAAGAKPFAERAGARVTASVGVCCCNGADAPSAKALVRQADEAVYEAKEAGRDRVCLRNFVPAPRPAAP